MWSVLATIYHTCALPVSLVWLRPHLQINFTTNHAIFMPTTTDMTKVVVFKSQTAFLQLAMIKKLQDVRLNYPPSTDSTSFKVHPSNVHFKPHNRVIVHHHVDVMVTVPEDNLHYQQIHSTFAIKMQPGLKPHDVINLISHRQLYWSSLYSNIRIAFKAVWLLQRFLNLLFRALHVTCQRLEAQLSSCAKYHHGIASRSIYS